MAVAIVGAVFAGVAGVGFALAPDSGVHPLTAEAVCPVAGCATVSCATGTTLFPNPMVTARCVVPRLVARRSSATAGILSRGRYHQASDMSLNLWILMPVSAGARPLVGRTRRLSKGERRCERLEIVFDIMLLASLSGGRKSGDDGECPCTNILARASSCSWLPMLWRAVRAWAAAAVGRSACSTACCWSRSRSASCRELMVSGTLLPSLGFYATGYYFWDPVACPFRQSTTSRPARSYCSAYTGGYVGVSPSFLQFFR